MIRREKGDQTKKRKLCWLYKKKTKFEHERHNGCGGKCSKKWTCFVDEKRTKEGKYWTELERKGKGRREKRVRKKGKREKFTE